MNTELTLFEKRTHSHVKKHANWRYQKKMARNAMGIVLIAVIIMAYFMAEDLLRFLITIELEIIGVVSLLSWINGSFDKREPEKITIPKEILKNIFILHPVDKENVVTVGADQSVKIFKKHCLREISFDIKKIGKKFFSKKKWLREGVMFDGHSFIPGSEIKFGENVFGIDKDGKTVIAHEFIDKNDKGIFLEIKKEEDKVSIVDFLENCAKMKPEPLVTPWFNTTKRNIVGFGGFFLIMIVGFIISFPEKVPIEIHGMKAGYEYVSIDIKEIFFYLLGGVAFAFSVLFYEPLPKK